MLYRVSVIKRLSLYVSALWGQDLLSIVHIREDFFKKTCENFVGTLETVRNREVSVKRGLTVIIMEFFIQMANITQGGFQ